MKELVLILEGKIKTTPKKQKTPTQWTVVGCKALQAFMQFIYEISTIQSQSSSTANHKHLTQTCSSPPLKSTCSFGTDCSGPGSPLCLHHLASTLTEQQKGPNRDLSLSLRLVLSRKSFISRTKDDPWIPKKRERQLIPLVVILPTFTFLFPEFRNLGICALEWSLTWGVPLTSTEILMWTITPLSKQKHHCWATSLVIFFFPICSSNTIKQKIVRK